MALKATNDLNSKLVTQAVGTGGALNAAFVELFTNVGLSSGADTAYSDLILPSYTGYTRQAVTWSAPVKNSSGSYEVVGQVVLNKMTGGTSSATVTGYALTTGVSVSTLEATEIFSTPVNVAGVGDFVAVVPIFSIPSDADLGDAAQIV